MIVSFGSTAKYDSCKDCTDRQVGCHSKCELYKEFQKNNSERKEAIRNYIREHNQTRWTVDQRLKNKKSNRNPNGYLEVHHRNCMERNKGEWAK